MFRHTLEDCEDKHLIDYRRSLESHIEGVKKYGSQLGLPVYQLESHDLSKFSEFEFPFYARNFFGDKKDQDGFAQAWLHHIHNNPHHWQYWIFPDNYTPKNTKVENGVIEMPQPFALEMIGDWMASSKQYTGSEDMGDWLKAHLPSIRLHSKTKIFVLEVLDSLGYADSIY